LSFRVNEPERVRLWIIQDVKSCHANNLSMKESPHGERMTILF
jgi:hypothetical protein